MRKITLTIKDDKKINFLIELLEQFDFIEIDKSGQKKRRAMIFLRLQDYGKTGGLMPINLEVRRGKGITNTLRYKNYH